MSVADVVAQARAVLVEIEEAQRGLVAALDRAERGCQLTAHLLLGSADPDVVWVVKSAADAAEPVKQAYEAFGRSAEIIRRYLDGIAGDVHAGPAAPPAHTVAAPPAAPPRVGTWRGKTASDYARDKGEGIGRRSPRGRKSVVREVDSVEEIKEIWVSLSQGGRRQDVDSYAGQVVVFPDGTRMALRSKSLTTPGVETIDLVFEDQRPIKIHVVRNRG